MRMEGVGQAGMQGEEPQLGSWQQQGAGCWPQAPPPTSCYDSEQAEAASLGSPLVV